MKSATESMPTLSIQIRICFSSFTLLYFVNHALTQMRWGVTYTYGCMYQLILYMIFLLLFFFVFPDFLKTKITHVTMSFGLNIFYWQSENSRGTISTPLAIYVTKKIPCYQSSFVVPPIVIETTTAGKVN